MRRPAASRGGAVHRELSASAKRALALGLHVFFHFPTGRHHRPKREAMLLWQPSPPICVLKV